MKKLKKSQKKMSNGLLSAAILARRHRPVASLIALNPLRQSICFVTYRRTDRASEMTRSVLHQRRCQPVSRTVLSPNVGKKRGEIEISIFAHFSSLPVTICPTGRSAKEPIMDLWDPLSFPHGAGKKPSGRSLFCQEASANQPIQVKTRSPLPVVLGWTQWGLLLLSIQC